MSKRQDKEIQSFLVRSEELRRAALQEDFAPLTEALTAYSNELGLLWKARSRFSNYWIKALAALMQAVTKFGPEKITVEQCLTLEEIGSSYLTEDPLTKVDFDHVCDMLAYSGFGYPEGTDD